MLKLVVAAAIALSAPIAVSSAAEAASTRVVVVQKDHHRAVHRPHQRCVSKKVVKRMHGKRVVKVTKVCR